MCCRDADVAAAPAVRCRAGLASSTRCQTLQPAFWALLRHFRIAKLLCVTAQPSCEHPARSHLSRLLWLKGPTNSLLIVHGSKNVVLWQRQAGEKVGSVPCGLQKLLSGLVAFWQQCLCSTPPDQARRRRCLMARHRVPPPPLLPPDGCRSLACLLDTCRCPGRLQTGSLMIGWPHLRVDASGRWSWPSRCALLAFLHFGLSQCHVPGRPQMSPMIVSKVWSPFVVSPCLQRVPGVVATCVGYAQGPTPNPTYEQVGDAADAPLTPACPVRWPAW